MSATAAGAPLVRAARFYGSSIGKKVVMAASGAVLVGFVIAHLAGNLQIYLGRDALDEYARMLRQAPAVVWSVRAVLLIALVAHIIASVQLARLKYEARPDSYVRKQNIASTYASRTMIWSGPIILAFVVYHLLHFTFGTVHPTHPNFEPTTVFDNVVRGFRSVPVSLAYIAAMLLLGLHLYHGVWSMFQSAGANHPSYSPRLKALAIVVTAFVVVGNISIPIAVLTGLVGR